MTKVFLSSLETNATQYIIDRCSQENMPMLYNLMSFYYLKQQSNETKMIIDKSQLIMIDSGAHSFQKGKKVEWREYTEKFAEWIKKNDEPKILGYFEMDVDNIIGYEKVLELRRILLKATDKIIPVWHKNRGVEEYKRMCRETKGKIVAITGFKNEDIRDEQYLMFLKYAWQYGKKVHCLGMTRKKLLDTIPFDYVDSSSWRQDAIYGNIKRDGKRIKAKKYTSETRDIAHYLSYLEGRKQQIYYEKKWKPVLENKEKYI